MSTFRSTMTSFNKSKIILFLNRYRVNANNETDVLKNMLKKAQDDVSVLLDEKRTLMDTVRSLQVRVIH